MEILTTKIEGDMVNEKEKKLKEERNEGAERYEANGENKKSEDFGPRRKKMRKGGVEISWISWNYLL